VFTESRDVVALNYPSAFNYLQTGTTCGPYSVAAVARVLGKNDISSEKVAATISYQIPRYGTHPLGIEQALREMDFIPESFRLHDASITDSERIAFLRSNLSAGQPIILLGEKKGVQHYLTLVGFHFEDKEFYVYDSWHDAGESGLTVDDNGVLPGNRTLSEEELLDFWSGGGVYGFYTWYAVVVSK